MKKPAFLNNMTRTINRAGLKFKKHSPEILIVAGVIGTVTSAVMACKATTKLSDILEESKEQVDAVHAATEVGIVNDVEYTEEDSKKDLTIIYTKTSLKVAKLYAPSVALGILSLSGIVLSHKMLTKRNVALAAAYTAVDKGFKEYRSRVVERFGKELDQELRFNVKAQEIEMTEIDKNGKEKTVTKTVNVVDPNNIGDFARMFDDGNPGWSKDPEQTLFFLKQQQSYANKLLQERGHLFVNEVYDLLGFKRTPMGNLAGWVYDEVNPIGDNFVDFGLYNPNKEKVRDFVNGRERAILLDFNIDGYVLDLIV